MVLALLAWSMLRIVRRAVSFEARLFFLVWFVTYFLFFTWWDPRVSKFFLPSAIALIALGAFALHDLIVAGRRTLEKRGYSKRVFDGVVGTAVGFALTLTFVFNLVGSVLPIRGNLGPTLGPHYEEARILAELLPDGCVASGFGHQLLYLAFYSYGGSTEHQGLSTRGMYQAYYDDVLSKDNTPEGKGRLQPFGDEACVLIKLSFLAERWFLYKTRPAVLARSPSGQSPEWRTFLDWYFQTVSAEDGELVTFDAFRLLVHEDRAYILVDRRLREQELGDYIAQTIDSYVDMYGNKFESRFAGRDRKLIFGYSGNLNIAEPAGLWTTLVDFVKSSDRVPPITH